MLRWFILTHICFALSANSKYMALDFSVSLVNSPFFFHKDMGPRRNVLSSPLFFPVRKGEGFIFGILELLPMFYFYDFDSVVELRM